MSMDADKYWDKLMAELRLADGIHPLTMAEAEALLDRLEPVPLSEERIESLIRSVTQRVQPRATPQRRARPKATRVTSGLFGVTVISHDKLYRVSIVSGAPIGNETWKRMPWSRYATHIGRRTERPAECRYVFQIAKAVVHLTPAALEAEYQAFLEVERLSPATTTWTRVSSQTQRHKPSRN
jgi:hypothetical protein